MADIEYYTRYLLSALAIAVLINCAISLLRLRPKKKVYAVLRDASTGEDHQITCYETSFGRARGSDIRLSLPSVSRSHAVLALKKDGFYIFDTESKAGVYVNGKKVDGSAKLSHGDTVAFGMAIMNFYIGSEAAGDIRSQDDIFRDFSLVNIVDGAEFPLEGDYVTIGRARGSNIEIAARNVSREQAVLTNENRSWYIHNYSRSNPTLLNGNPIYSPQLLKIGDVIKFGDYAFLFDERDNAQ